jgi:hypothetical protein
MAKISARTGATERLKYAVICIMEYYDRRHTPKDFVLLLRIVNIRRLID